MFYDMKFLFFIIIYIFSYVLYYFIKQQILLVGIFDNMFFSTGIIFVAIILSSYILSFIIMKIYNFLPVYIKNKSNKNFILWLLFTVISYITVFVIFAVATSY